MTGFSADAAIADFYAESKEDYIGLWQLIGRAEEHFPDNAEMRRKVLQMVRMLLAHGLQAVDLTKDGGCILWNEQEPNRVIERIQREWDELGVTPSIGDIVWFYLPR